MTTNKAPAEKLPLAVRKNVRDSFENVKPDLQSQISALLGAPWTIDINPLAIYPYAEDDSYGQKSLGDCIAAYINGAIWQMKRFVENHGEEFKNEMNSVCTNHAVTFTVSAAVRYCGCDIESGCLRLLFQPGYLGSNIDSACSELATVLSAAPQPAGAPALSYAARHSVKTDYEPHVGALLEKARAALQNPELKFEPGFEELSKSLKGGKDVRDDWETNLGNFARRYYEGFVDVLDREKFGEDEMLREGFEEGVPSGIVKLRIKDKINSSYNEIVLDEGALVLQTIPAYWGTNIDGTASKLVDIL